jgi:hypothetical protein
MCVYTHKHEHKNIHTYSPTYTHTHIHSDIHTSRAQKLEKVRSRDASALVIVQRMEPQASLRHNGLIHSKGTPAPRFIQHSYTSNFPLFFLLTYIVAIYICDGEKEKSIHNTSGACVLCWIVCHGLFTVHERQRRRTLRRRR